MFLEAGAQFFRLRETCSVARRHHDIHRRQRVLVQAKRFAREALEAIADNGSSGGARRDRQPQSRTASIVRHNGQVEIGVGQSFATLPDRAKFGRLVQTLARLERQFTDR